MSRLSPKSPLCLLPVFLVTFLMMASAVLSAPGVTLAQTPPNPQAGYWEETESFTHELSFEVTQDGKIRNFYFNYDMAGITCKIEVKDDIPIEQGKFEARLLSNGQPTAGIWGEFTSDTSAEGGLMCLQNGQTAMWKADWQYSLTSSPDTTSPDTTAEPTVQIATITPKPDFTATPQPTNTATAAPVPSATPSATPVEVEAGTYIAGDTPEVMMESLAEVGVIPAVSGFLVEEDQIIIDLSSQPNQFSWTFLDGQYYADFVLGGDIVWGPGDQEDSCGFAIRMRNVSDFYAVFLNQERVLWFQEYSKETWQNPVVGETPTFHVGPNRQNRLLIVAQGDTFTLFLNGEYAGQFRDDSRKWGRIAALMSTYNSSEKTNCSFNRLWVWNLTADVPPPTETPAATPASVGMR